MTRGKPEWRAAGDTPARTPRSAARMATAAIVAVTVFLTSCSSYPPLADAPSVLPNGVSMYDDGQFIRLLPEQATAAGYTGCPCESTASPAPAGLIFYPGGLVEPEAYVSMLAPIAAAGHPVVIVRMPLDLAVFGYRRADDALSSDRRWAIAGHSLGGAMAARFLAREGEDHPMLEGLVLLGAYPADDLSGSGYRVVSIWATEDGLATADEREETASLLPPQTDYVIIEGGNHAGFGEYGPQRDDGERTIPLAAQHEQTQAALLSLLAEIE